MNFAQHSWIAANPSVGPSEHPDLSLARCWQYTGYDHALRELFDVSPSSSAAAVVTDGNDAFAALSGLGTPQGTAGSCC